MEDGRGSGKFSYEREEIHQHERPATSERDMEDREAASTGECSVFVTDIARGVTDEHLKEKFRDYGTVQDAFVVKNKFTGETKGYGFVRFGTVEEVYAVLDAKELPRFEDSVSHKVQMVKATMADAKDTLLVINIPRGWEETDLLKALTELASEAPRKVKFSGAGKATAYASYTDHVQALRVLKCIQRPPTGHPPPAFAAYLAPPRVFDAKNAPTMKILFVRGTTGVNSDTLKKLFGGPEVVEKVIIPTDSSKGGPVGHAFVHFFSTKAAAEAKDALNGHDLDGSRLSVEWCLPKNVTHKKTPAPHAAAAAGGHYPYPYYPGYPFYPEYDPYYPPPPAPYYAGYDSYSGGYDSHRGASDYHRSSSSDSHHRSSSQYSHHYPPSSSHGGYAPYPKSSSSSSYRQQSSPPSSRPHQYPPSSGYERNSRSSGGYPPSSSYSSGGRSNSRYVPY